MTFSEGLDFVVRLLTILGFPTVVAWFLYDRRRLRAQNSETEATAPNRVRSSSVISLEGEIMALSNSFDTDRHVKEETISFLQQQLDEARDSIAERDRLIDDLQTQMSALKVKVRIVTRDLELIQAELDAMHRRRSEA